MRLNQALKLKNRLAGELQRLTSIFMREKSKRNDNVSKVDPKAVWLEMQTVREELTILKGKICRANIGIYPVLEEMAELKALISTVQSLNTREGEEIAFVGRDQEKLTYVYTAFMNRQKVDDLVKKTQQILDELQDKVDHYNATTEIE